MYRFGERQRFNRALRGRHADGGLALKHFLVDVAGTRLLGGIWNALLPRVSFIAPYGASRECSKPHRIRFWTDSHADLIVGSGRVGSTGRLCSRTGIDTSKLDLSELLSQPAEFSRKQFMEVCIHRDLPTPYRASTSKGSPAG